MLLLLSKYKSRASKAWTQRYALSHTAVLIVCMRMGLWLLPYKRLCKLVDHLSRTSRPRRSLSHAEKKQVIWAVRSLSKRMMPDKPCLTQALVLKWRLQKAGEESDIHIGVRKNEDGEFAAHAWLEQDGQVLIGGKTSPFQYSRLKRDKVRLS